MEAPNADTNSVASGSRNQYQDFSMQNGAASSDGALKKLNAEVGRRGGSGDDGEEADIYVDDDRDYSS